MIYVFFITGSIGVSKNDSADRNGLSVKNVTAVYNCLLYTSCILMKFYDNKKTPIDGICGRRHQFVCSCRKHGWTRGMYTVGQHIFSTVTPITQNCFTQIDEQTRVRLLVNNTVKCKLPIINPSHGKRRVNMCRPAFHVVICTGVTFWRRNVITRMSNVQSDHRFVSFKAISSSDARNSLHPNSNYECIDSVKQLFENLSNFVWESHLHEAPITHWHAIFYTEVTFD